MTIPQIINTCQFKKGVKPMKVKLTHAGIFIFAIILTAAFIGCGGAMVGQTKKIDGQMWTYDEHEIWIPSWVKGSLPYADQGGYRDVLQAVGSSAPTANPELARKRATSGGRAELSRILGVKVQNLIKEWTQEHTDYFDGTGDSSIVYYEEVGRQVTDADLVGSTVDITWTHPKTRMTYALISISRSDAIEQAMKRAQEIARIKKTRFVEKKVDDAMQELDDILKKTKPEDFYESGTISE
jgi:hypothetical protein